MKKNNYYLLSILPLLISLLIGCASTGINTKEENTEKAEAKDQNEKIDNISIRMSTFILGIGDTVEISVYRQDDLQRTVRIGHSGIITLPLIGDVQAAGKDIFKLREEIKERLSKYLTDPQVIVNVTTVQSQKIIVLGEVNSPGIFTLEYDINVVEAISRAGGMTNDAKLNNVLLIRREQGKPTASVLNLKKALKEGDITPQTAAAHILSPDEALSRTNTEAACI